jgi:hypothetical protein
VKSTVFCLPVIVAVDDFTLFLPKIKDCYVISDPWEAARFPGTGWYLGGLLVLVLMLAGTYFDPALDLYLKPAVDSLKSIPALLPIRLARSISFFICDMASCCTT